MNKALFYCLAFSAVLAIYSVQQLQYSRTVYFEGAKREAFVYPNRTIEFHGIHGVRIYEENGRVWLEASVFCGRRPPLHYPRREDPDATALWRHTFENSFPSSHR